MKNSIEKILITVVFILINQSIFAANVPASKTDKMIPDNYEYFNLESNSCWVGRYGEITTESLDGCAKKCADKEEATAGSCAGMAFKITNYVTGSRTSTTGECILKGVVEKYEPEKNYDCDLISPFPLYFDSTVFQVFRYLGHDQNKQLEYDPDDLIVTLFNPMPIKNVPTAAPVSKSVTYAAANPILELGKINSAQGGVFCKTQTVSGNATFAALPVGNDKIVRCFAYIPSAVGMGKCYIKDFSKGNITAGADVTTSWTADTAPTYDQLLCAIEGGEEVKAALARPFVESFDIRLLDSTPTTDMTAEQMKSSVQFSLHTKDFVPLTVAPANPNTQYFCKTKAALPTPLGADKVRCYAFTPAQGSTAGKCYASPAGDFSKGSVVALTFDQYTLQPNNVCATEGGPSAVKALKPKIIYQAVFPPIFDQVTGSVSKTANGAYARDSALSDGSFCNHISPFVKVTAAGGQATEQSKAQKRALNQLANVSLEGCYSECDKDTNCLYVLYSDTTKQCYLFPRIASDGAVATNVGCVPFVESQEPDGKTKKLNTAGKLISPEDKSANPDGYRYYIKRMQ